MNILDAPLTPPEDNVLHLDWRRNLAGSKDGNFYGHEQNLLMALRSAPELFGLVRWNEFSRRVEFTRCAPWRKTSMGTRWYDDDDFYLSGWMQQRKIMVRGQSLVASSISAVSKDNSVHPVREFLESLKWDCQGRISSWLKTYLGATDNAEYLTAVGRRWLISAVARVMRPGCQADHTLVFEGIQGARKSTAAQALCVNDDWFCDRLPDLHSADAEQQLAGKWIVELGELAAIKGRQSVESTKAFLTRRIGSYRPPYGRHPVDVPRQCVFIGSTNEQAYLSDRTGNRRFWPVKCGQVDITALREVMPLLWAEAMVEFKQGEQWHLLPSEEGLAGDEQQQRLIITEIETDVAEFLEARAASGVTEVSIKDVLVYGLHLDPDKDTYHDRAVRLGAQVAAAMESAGWARYKRLGRGTARRTIYKLKEK